MENDKKQYLKAVEVKEMMSSKGWEIVSSLFDEVERSSINKMVEDGNEEARVMVKSIRKLRQAIQSIVGLGARSYKQLKKENHDG